MYMGLHIDKDMYIYIYERDLGAIAREKERKATCSNAACFSQKEWLQISGRQKSFKKEPPGGGCRC